MAAGNQVSELFVVFVKWLSRCEGQCSYLLSKLILSFYPSACNWRTSISGDGYTTVRRCCRTAWQHGCWFVFLTLYLSKIFFKFKKNRTELNFIFIQSLTDAGKLFSIKQKLFLQQLSNSYTAPMLLYLLKLFIYLSLIYWISQKKN